MFTNGQTVNMQAVMKDNMVIQKLLALIAAEKASMIEGTQTELEEVLDMLNLSPVPYHRAWWIRNKIWQEVLFLFTLQKFAYPFEFIKGAYILLI